MPIVFLGLQSLTVRHCGSHFASSDARFFEPSLLVSIVFCAFWFSDCFTTDSFNRVFCYLQELVGDLESPSAPPLMRSWGIWLVLFSSGVRHLRGSGLPKFLLFLGSVVSGILSLDQQIFCIKCRGSEFSQNTWIGECLSWA